jgi:MG2 domain
LTPDLQDAYKLSSIIIDEQKSLCSQESAIVFGNVVKRPLVLIKTDKPIYKPGDEVRFLVLVLDSDTRPIDDKSVQVNVIDSKGNIVRKIDETKSKDAGVFEGSVGISSEPNLGAWELEVSIDNSEHKTAKIFNVEKFEMPPFTLFVETSAAVNFEDNFVNFKIFALDSNNQIVNGNVKLTAFAYYENKPQRKIKEVSKEAQMSVNNQYLELNLKKDLKINFLLKNLILNIEVEFEDQNSKKKAKQTRKVLVLVKGKNFIRVRKPEFFYPGYMYAINVVVEKLDGTLDMRTAEPLKLNFMYNPSQGKQYVQHQFLKNGKAKFVLKPSETVESIDVKFEFDGTSLEDKILPFPSALNSNFIKVTSLTEE